jgi:hypothetical protein
MLGLNAKVIVRFKFKRYFGSFQEAYEFIGDKIARPYKIMYTGNGEVQYFEYSGKPDTFRVKKRSDTEEWYLEYIVADGRANHINLSIPQYKVDSIIQKVKSIIADCDIEYTPEINIWHWSDAMPEPLDW